MLSNGTVIIDNVSSTDAGRYTCTAVNRHRAQASETVDIRVIGEIIYFILSNRARVYNIQDVCARPFGAQVSCPEPLQSPPKYIFLCL